MIRGVDWINLAPDKGQMADCCDEGDEYWGSVKFGEVFDYLRNCKILKKGVCCLESVR